jgi:hypothetical protein
MKKGTGYYLKSYLKNNLAVLVFELIIIMLLAVICTVLLGGEPLWLGPVLTLCAYLLAELRFMMSYVASKTRKQAETEQEASKQMPDELEEEGKESEEVQDAFVLTAIAQTAPYDSTEMPDEPKTKEVEQSECEAAIDPMPVIEEVADQDTTIEKLTGQETTDEETTIEDMPIEEPAMEEAMSVGSDMAEPDDTFDVEDDFDDFDDDMGLPVRQSTLDLGDE